MYSRPDIHLESMQLAQLLKRKKERKAEEKRIRSFFAAGLAGHAISINLNFYVCGLLLILILL